MKTGLITSDTYQNHNTGDGHPEKVDRVTAIIDNFKKLDNKNLVWKKPVKFNKSLLETTHNSSYINFVENSFPKQGLSFLDGDTIISPGSKDATKDAVGSIIAALSGSEGDFFSSSSLYGFFAIILAAVNIFGGFLVTQRMLAMYKKKKKNK